MPVISLLAGSLTGIYGLLNILAGYSQTKSKQIPTGSAWLMLAFGLVLLISGIVLALQWPYAIIILLVGLLAIHILTISNGIHMYGKVNLRHHILRLVISIVLLGLAFWSLH